MLVVVAGLLTVAAGTAKAAPPDDPGGGKQGPGKHGITLRLKPGETSTNRIVKTAEGSELLTLERVGDPIGRRGEQTRDVTTQAWQTGGCHVWISDPTGSLWRMDLWSWFHYNYETLYQDPPQVYVQSVWPYSWSGVSAWNSYWSYTVRFADAMGYLHVNYPVPDTLITTKHIYVQEDAWGELHGLLLNSSPAHGGAER